jgi:mono/diheme cytochrome c family protein
MNLVYAVLLLLVAAGACFVVQKFSQTKVVENSSSGIIDYIESVDSLPKKISAGKILYLKKCASCHGVFTSNDGALQTLAGIESKWPDKKELFAFIRNPEQVMKTNSYVKELRKKYGSTMTSFPDMTDDEIQAILDYIKTETQIREKGIP